MSSHTLSWLLSVLDHTILVPEQGESVLRQIQEDYRKLQHLGLSYPHALCTYPQVMQVFLKKTDISSFPSSLCCVIGFPDGMDLWESKREQIFRLLKMGPIHEVDIVPALGFALEGDIHFVVEEIRFLVSELQKEAPECRMKVIVETPSWEAQKKESLLEELVWHLLEIGVHFVKTCTGRRGPATLQSVKRIARIIEAYFQKTGKRAGLKISGGIRTMDDALVLAKSVAEIYGLEVAQLSSRWFRIGASQLLKNIIASIDAE